MQVFCHCCGGFDDPDDLQTIDNSRSFSSEAEVWRTYVGYELSQHPGLLEDGRMKQTLNNSVCTFVTGTPVPCCQKTWMTPFGLSSGLAVGQRGYGMSICNDETGVQNIHGQLSCIVLYPRFRARVAWDPYFMSCGSGTKHRIYKRNDDLPSQPLLLSTPGRRTVPKVSR